jgi:uncharacterized membrane-anchored protein
MRTKFREAGFKEKFVIIVAAQILFLIVIALSRFWIINTGEMVLLKTAPMDPRDMMMGDYVNLSYEISTLPDNIVHREQMTRKPQSGDRQQIKRNKAVYVVLKTQGKYHVASGAYLQKPALKPGEVLIKGRCLYDWGEATSVFYGIERFYVPEGKGVEIEQLPNQVDVQVKLSSGGNAVIHRVFVNGKELPFS